jgi:hypothetical protein
VRRERRLITLRSTTFDNISLKKPFLVVQVDQEMDCGAINKWFGEYDIQILNIAGPRQSKYPDIYLKTKNFLMELLR